MKTSIPVISSTDGGMSSHAVAQCLSDAIHEHRLSPGMKLGEDELGEIYGVSRTIVRSALQSLAHDQLVDIKRNRGAFVASPTPREADEVFEARLLIEPRTAETAAVRATPQDITLLRQHIADEHEAIAAGDRGRALALSGKFHIEIAKIADQHTIANIVRSLVERSSLIIALYWRRQGVLCESDAHHALLGAIESGNGQMTQDLMKRHLEDLHEGLNLRQTDSKHVSLRDSLLHPSNRAFDRSTTA